MENEVNKNSIKENVMNAVNAGKLSMRPRWHFILQTILLILGAVVVALTLLYLTSFVIFAIRRSGIWFVPIFGPRGWIELAASLPWILVVVAFLFLVVLEMLVRRFQFGNRQPLLYTAVGIILLALVGGVLAEPIHRGVFRITNDMHAPLLREFYHEFGIPHLSRVHVGIISEPTSDGFILNDQDHDESFRVIVTPQTRFPLGTEFSQGDAVVVFGNRDDGTIHALGVREINGEIEPVSPIQMPVRHYLRFQWDLK